MQIIISRTFADIKIDNQGFAIDISLVGTDINNLSKLNCNDPKSVEDYLSSEKLKAISIDDFRKQNCLKNGDTLQIVISDKGGYPSGDGSKTNIDKITVIGGENIRLEKEKKDSGQISNFINAQKKTIGENYYQIGPTFYSDANSTDGLLYIKADISVYQSKAKNIGQPSECNSFFEKNFGYLFCDTNVTKYHLENIVSTTDKFIKLSSPVNGVSISEQPTFSFLNIQNATSFNLQIAEKSNSNESQDFTKTIIGEKLDRDELISSTNTQDDNLSLRGEEIWSKLETGKTYYWRVYPIFSENVWGAPDTFEFTKAVQNRL